MTKEENSESANASAGRIRKLWSRSARVRAGVQVPFAVWSATGAAGPPPPAPRLDPGVEPPKMDRPLDAELREQKEWAQYELIRKKEEVSRLPGPVEERRISQRRRENRERSPERKVDRSRDRGR